jgi:hypothetical protein
MGSGAARGASDTGSVPTSEEAGASPSPMSGEAPSTTAGDGAIGLIEQRHGEGAPPPPFDSPQHAIGGPALQGSDA